MSRVTRTLLKIDHVQEVASVTSDEWATTAGSGDPFESDKDREAREERELRDRQLGTVIKLLESREQSKAVGYLLGCDKMEFVYNDYWNNTAHFDIALHVAIDQFDNFSDNDVHREIVDAYDIVLRPRNEEAAGVVLQPTLVDANWRETRARTQASKFTNQAALKPPAEHHPIVDGMHFRDNAEKRLYDALIFAQREKYSATDTLGIVPNCAVRVLDFTWEPDFIITFRGRVGVIEVDGRSHEVARKWASDKSRDELLQNAGMMVVQRIDVKDAEKWDEALAFVKSFLDKLTRIR